MRPSEKWAKPQEWKSGAAMCVFWRAFTGIFDSSDTTGSSDCGLAREAPFGDPVVPLVRIVARPSRSGGTTSEGSPPAISSPIVGYGRSSESCQAMKRLRRFAASESRSPNSSS